MLMIKNKAQLIKNASTPLNKKARRLALESLEAALNAADPKQMLKSKLALKDSTLTVGTRLFNLEKFRNVYVLGGGKASGRMAEALESILGNRITSGIVNVPHGTRNETVRIKLHGASHPMPDEAGVEGTRAMLDMVKNPKRDDLIICLLSGGGSSLMPLPRGAISLEDKKEITQVLLKSGATINEVNTVRKHISDFKGGWLAQKVYPATIINLILSDVVGDPLDFIASGPTVPDSTTFKDAIGTLKKYKLWEKTPASIVKLLSGGEKGLIPDTPKSGDKAFEKVYNLVVGNNRYSSQEACKYLRNNYVHSLLLTATLEGEASQVGTVFASMTREILISGNPGKKPIGLVAGGETTVTVKGEGLGGRNQELTLAASSKLNGLDGAVLASLSTDGVDGPTDAAGAIADGETLKRALKKGLDPSKFLENNDSYHFFSSLSDLIRTGPTGTNVNDLTIIVVI